MPKRVPFTPVPEPPRVSWWLENHDGLTFSDRLAKRTAETWGRYAELTTLTFGADEPGHRKKKAETIF